MMEEVNHRMLRGEKESRKINKCNEFRCADIICVHASVCVCLPSVISAET